MEAVRPPFVSKTAAPLHVISLLLGLLVQKITSTKVQKLTPAALLQGERVVARGRRRSARASRYGIRLIGVGLIGDRCARRYVGLIIGVASGGAPRALCWRVRGRYCLPDDEVVDFLFAPEHV